jgi:LL-diaminopimelate aminotransferase
MSTFHPADRLENVSEYIFARLNKAAKAVSQKSGRPIMSFAAGSPDIAPSSRYTAKFAEFVQESGAHVYPGYRATPELTSALQAWYKQKYNVVLDGDELLPLNGEKDGNTHLPLALFNSGEKFLIPDPGYPPFRDPALLVGAQPVAYNLDAENEFRLDLQQIESKLTSDIRYIWVNFPSNPTGQVASLDELKKLVDFAKTNSLFILYDNAYADITFDGFQAPSILQVEGAKDVAVELGSMSKSHSFAGFRIGWIVGNAAVIDALATVKSQMDSGMSLPLQRLAAYALNNPDEAWSKAMIDEYRHRRDVICGHLKSLGLEFTVPEGSLYIWAKIPDSAKDSESYCMELLEEKQILLTPGSEYGKNGDRYVRISFCVNIDGIEDYFS